MLWRLFSPGPSAGAAQCDEDIAWSSSDEDQESRLSGAAARRQQGPAPGQRRATAPIHPSRARRGHASGTGEWKHAHRRIKEILIAVASVGPEVVALFLVQTTSQPLKRTATRKTRRATASSRFPTVTPSPVTNSRNRLNPQT